jgi:hypothetical protein
VNPQNGHSGLADGGTEAHLGQKIIFFGFANYQPHGWWMKEEKSVYIAKRIWFNDG